MKIVAIGDVHAPFHCKKSIARSIVEIRALKPDAVVQVGDIYDFFSFSRFPKKPGVIHPGKELEDAYQTALDFWAAIRKAAPKASLYQLTGNHCVRPLKLTVERCPEIYPLVMRSWKELFKFPGVSTILDTRDDLVLDQIAFEHGYFMRPGLHLRENMMNTVIGHTHRPWIHYEAIRNKVLWEMNVGYVANPAHDALNYTRKRWNKWVKGISVIDSRCPRFIIF